MKEYLNKLEKLIKKYNKAQVAVWLTVKDTRTIDAWFVRKSIPSKYLDAIKELK